MGQATVDLPDPLQQSNPAEAKNADDLLAQMAGDEIDRLLAETDSGPAPVETSIPLLEAVESDPIPPTKPHGKAESANSTKHTESDKPVYSEKESASETASTGAIDLDAVLQTAVMESEARGSKPTEAIATPVITKAIDTSPAIELGERRLPLFLRPLEWFSSPLDPWPDQLREVIGKVGLMTLINALAVLAYVLIFRKHHH